MATDLTTRAAREAGEPRSDRWVTVHVGGRALAVPLGCVREAAALGAVTPVPLAPAKVRGMVGIGGRTATAIDLRRALGLPPAPPGAGEIGLAVEIDGYLYVLIADSVDGVTRMDPDKPAVPPLDLAGVVAR